MNDLDRTIDGVADEPSIHSSVTKMLHNVASHFKRHSTNPDGIENYADMIHDTASIMADHVMANTPIVVGTHPVPPSVDPKQKPKTP